MRLVHLGENERIAGITAVVLKTSDEGLSFDSLIGIRWGTGRRYEAGQTTGAELEA